MFTIILDGFLGEETEDKKPLGYERKAGAHGVHHQPFKYKQTLHSQVGELLRFIAFCTQEGCLHFLWYKFEAWLLSPCQTYPLSNPAIL